MVLSLLVAMTVAFPADTRLPPEHPRDPQGIRLFPKGIQTQLRGLKRPLNIDKAVSDIALKDVLNFLEDFANHAEKSTALGDQVLILVDSMAFKRNKADGAYKVEDEKVELPRCPGATLETILHLVTQQVDGTFVVRGDHILITTWEAALPGRRIRDKDGFGLGAVNLLVEPKERRVRDKGPVCLVHWAAELQPLDQVLTDLCLHYEKSIILSPEAAKKANRPVSVRLLNVPLSEAVESLAEAHGLKLIVKQNLYLIVEAETAVEPRKKSRREAKEAEMAWYEFPVTSRKRMIPLPQGCPIFPPVRELPAGTEK